MSFVEAQELSTYGGGVVPLTSPLLYPFDTTEGSNVLVNEINHSFTTNHRQSIRTGQRHLQRYLIKDGWCHMA